MIEELFRGVFWGFIGVGMILWMTAIYLFCKNTFYLDEWKDTLLEALHRDIRIEGIPMVVCAKCGNGGFHFICEECGSKETISKTLFPLEGQESIQDYIRKADRIMGNE